MQEIKTRRSLLFYFGVIAPALLFIAFGIVPLQEYLEQQKNPHAATINGPLIGIIFCYSLAVITPLALFRATPTIKVKGNQISLGWKSYKIDDIVDVKLTGKHSNGFFENASEGCMIKFNNGKRKILSDDLYTNLWEIKLYIEENIHNIKNEKHYRYLNPSNKEVVFKGNQFLSFRGTLYWGSTIIFPYVFITNGFSKSISEVILFATGWACWVLGFSYLFHYVLVDVEYLTIKNHNLIWRKKKYKLSDVREVVFESPATRLPNFIRVITNDYKSKRYPASTLTRKNWLALKKHLDRLGIPVRNECIYE